jgi:hypothetical protein
MMEWVFHPLFQRGLGKGDSYECHWFVFVVVVKMQSFAIKSIEKYDFNQ